MDGVEFNFGDMEQSLHVNKSQFDTPDQVEPGILPPTVPTTATQERAIPPVPTEVPLPCDLSGNRIFLDVCSGVSQPLSAALKQFNADTLAFDILINPQSNLLDDAMFDKIKIPFTLESTFFLTEKIGISTKGGRRP